MYNGNKIKVKATSFPEANNPFDAASATLNFERKVGM